MQVVIAGSYHEYFIFLKEKGLPRTTTHYLFISDPTRLYGLEHITIVCVGDYQRSPVWTFTYRRKVTRERDLRFIDEVGTLVSYR